MTFFEKAIYNVANSIGAFDYRYASDKIYANVLPPLVRDQ